MILTVGLLSEKATYAVLAGRMIDLAMTSDVNRVLLEDPSAYFAVARFIRLSVCDK
jgi:hypothetical protein